MRNGPSRLGAKRIGDLMIQSQSLADMQSTYPTHGRHANQQVPDDAPPSALRLAPAHRNSPQKNTGTRASAVGSWARAPKSPAHSPAPRPAPNRCRAGRPTYIRALARTPASKTVVMTKFDYGSCCAPTRHIPPCNAPHRRYTRTHGKRRFVPRSGGVSRWAQASGSRAQ